MYIHFEPAPVPAEAGVPEPSEECSAYTACEEAAAGEKEGDNEAGVEFFVLPLPRALGLAAVVAMKVCKAI